MKTQRYNSGGTITEGVALESTSEICSQLIKAESIQELAQLEELLGDSFEKCLHL